MNDHVANEGHKLTPLVTAHRPNMRRRLLHSLHSVLGWTGVDKWYVRRKQIRGAVILMYHSVAKRSAAEWIDPANWMAPERFANQMAFLAARRHVVSLGDLTETIAKGEDPEPGTVVITFDDGYLDNLTVAAPVLAEYGFPATLFLPTGYIDRGENQWVDQLYSLFRARTRDHITLDGEPFSLRNAESVTAAYRAMAAKLLEALPEERSRVLAELEAQLEPFAESPRLTMTWDDVRELKERYPVFEFGAHTREHLDLETHGDAMAEDETRGSRDRIAHELGQPPRHFSFPYNRRNDTALAAVREAGFDAAVGPGP
ncbi:MAG: polysaccharide deacetylase family protein, partial [Candidatus Hydrogenedentota bacterium]